MPGGTPPTPTTHRNQAPAGPRLGGATTLNATRRASAKTTTTPIVRKPPSLRVLTVMFIVVRQMHLLVLPRGEQPAMTTATAGPTVSVTFQQALTDLQRAGTEHANIASSARAAQQKADAATADAQHSQVPVDRYPGAITPQT